MLNWKKVIMLLVILLLALTGCENEKKTVNGIHEHLEEAVLLEKGFEKVQTPILDAEKKEQQIYEEIIKLSLEDYDQIKLLTSNAIDSANQRKKLLDKEKESIELANKEFLLIKPLIEKIKSKGLRENSDSLVVKMKERYDAYLVLNEEYNKGIDADIKLYELLQKKDISITELEEHIKKLNKQYELIMNAKDVFNDKTEAYNQSKKEFYKVAEIDVEINY